MAPFISDLEKILPGGTQPVSTLPAAPSNCSLPLPTRIAFVGNYLPRQCGIATFTTDLCTALASEFGGDRLFAWSLTRRTEPPMSELPSFSTSTAMTWSACNMNTAFMAVLQAGTY